MKIKTSELEGSALDWAVAVVEGFKVTAVRGAMILDGEYTEELAHIPLPNYGLRYSPAYRPSTDWSQGGPLIEKFGIWLSDDATDEPEGPWIGSINGFAMHYAKTPLIAACRAIVAAKLGDVVEVPDELA